MPSKIDRIKSETLRCSLAEAQADLRAGNYPGVVHRAAEAYAQMLRRKPELLIGPMAMRRLIFFPRLGARLIIQQDGSPTVVYDREQFTFSEAVTYFEFALDSLVREEM